MLIHRWTSYKIFQRLNALEINSYGVSLVIRPAARDIVSHANRALLCHYPARNRPLIFRNINFRQTLTRFPIFAITFSVYAIELLFVLAALKCSPLRPARMMRVFGVVPRGYSRLYLLSFVLEENTTEECCRE